jgi:molybdopterin adenylyltransferase
LRIAVVTVSDRASRGAYADLSGPAVEEALLSAIPGALVEREIVEDGIESVTAALARHPDAEWILTAGGTGPSPRDRTPEATRSYCDRLLPGISEYLRARSLEQAPTAVFSRGEAGMRGAQFIVNFPGSERAARFCAQALAPLMAHGSAMARGEGHG